VITSWWQMSDEGQMLVVPARLVGAGQTRAHLKTGQSTGECPREDRQGDSGWARG